MKVAMLLVMWVAVMVAPGHGILGPVCPPSGCAAISCLAVTSCDGRLDSNGGFCGCCPVCVRQLGEGELCLDDFLLGVPRHSECGTGLHCDAATAKCVKLSKRAAGPCLKKLQEVEGLLQQHGGMLLGLEKPRCEPDGTFSAVQCTGSKCYCVGPDGTEVDGYSVDRWTATGMDCKCARDLQVYMASGLIGKLFYCEPNGNYPPQ